MQLTITKLKIHFALGLFFLAAPLTIEKNTMAKGGMLLPPSGQQ
jgi:hypothetical protein